MGPPTFVAALGARTQNKPPLSSLSFCRVTVVWKPRVYHQWFVHTVVVERHCPQSAVPVFMIIWIAGGEKREFWVKQCACTSLLELKKKKTTCLIVLSSF